MCERDGNQSLQKRGGHVPLSLYGSYVLFKFGNTNVKNFHPYLCGQNNEQPVMWSDNIYEELGIKASRKLFPVLNIKSIFWYIEHLMKA